MARPRCLKHGPEYWGTRISQGKLVSYCTGCASDARQRYRERHSAERLQDQAFSHYAISCRKCGTEDRERLVIEGGKELLEWLRDMGWPPDYPIRAICRQCRFATQRNIARYHYAAIARYHARKKAGGAP